MGLDITDSVKINTQNIIDFYNKYSKKHPDLGDATLSEEFLKVLESNAFRLVQNEKCRWPLIVQRVVCLNT